MNDDHLWLYHRIAGFIVLPAMWQVAAQQYQFRPFKVADMIANKSFSGTVFNQGDLEIHMAFQHIVFLDLNPVCADSKRLIRREREILVNVLHEKQACSMSKKRQSAAGKLKNRYQFPNIGTQNCKYYPSILQKPVNPLSKAVSHPVF